MKKVSALQIINVVALILTIAMNAISVTEVLPGALNMAEAGESRAVFFLPDGYVFAIWSVIYIGLIAFVIYQARPSQKDSDVVNAIGWWFVASSAGNIVWLILFVYDLVWLSTLAMIVVLVSLLMIYIRLEIGTKAVTAAEKWAVHMPFSIYLGWISVATVANFSTAFYEIGAVTSFLGIGADIWATIMMIVAAALAFGMLYFRRDIAYALVIVWATYGINARPFDTDLFTILSSLNVNLVNTTALSVAGIVAVAAVVTLMMSFRNRISA